MGYCHYWKRERSIEPATFGRIVQDFKQIVLALDDEGVRLAGPLGEGLPEITEEQIAFNGLADCGHPENDEICIPFPDANASGVGSSADAISDGWSIGVQLRHRTCNGDCSYESFVFERVCAPVAGGCEDICGDYCKTGFRPYDFAVQALLLIAKHHLRDRIEVHSGGSDIHWRDARALCYLHLGYPLLEFRMDRERGLVEDTEMS